MQSKDLEPRPLSPVWSGTPLTVYWATAPAHMASCYCVTGSSALATWLIRDLGLDIFGQMGQGTTLVVSVFFGCFSHCFVICYSRVIACAKDWTSLLVFLALSFFFRLFRCLFNIDQIDIKSGTQTKNVAKFSAAYFGPTNLFYRFSAR